MSGLPGGRRRLTLLVVPMVIVAIASYIGDALSPTLLVEAPLLLVALVPRNRVLVLAAPQLAFVPFFVVGMVRLALTDPLYYLFGRWYGDRAIAWAEHHSGAPRTVRAIERWFRRLAYPVVLVAPNSLVCVLAGATGMSVPGFLIANLGGTALRMVLIWFLGDIFSEPLLDVVGFIADYRWWFTGITIVLVAFSIWRARRAGTSDLETVEEVEAELEEEPSEG
jgi:membrane protein DedA with SNARE-associated domain